MKKRILVLAFEYFPMSNANTRIIRNVCSLLAGEYSIDLVASRKGNTEPAEENTDGFRVLRVPEYSYHPEKCTGTLTPGVLARMTSAKLRGKLQHDESIPMLHRMYEYGIRKAVRFSDYDAMVSFSAPFLTHCCASRLAKDSGLPWIAVYFDPYFSGSIFDPALRDARKRQEEDVMAPAKKILMTYPTDRDYIRNGVRFKDRIIGAELPGIAPQETAETPAAGGKCVCTFFGSLYRGIRDPRAAVALLSAVGDEIEPRFVGSISEADVKPEDFFPAGGPCRYLGPKSGEDLAREYAEADILVNIGNSVGNQMPSKIFEYIGTGKPILNLYKIPDCPTLKYLEKYPAALNLSDAQIEADPEGCAEQVRAFCRKFRGVRVPAEEIRKLYPENTYEAFAEQLRRTIDETLKG